ncbi:hypothetical protein [Thermanaeromonas sp. C210]|uniref:hypothetical protein n=1 Tax=Thermanaeromonas sp. C210 TaxID=2731925 RepID=UPI00155C9B6F|nr:hypothetical protein [Thermanaeromonas sp. C210]GFN22019.1 hypothetical protein TAMC210_03350 [Thermanaeromonas sp. C210]
MRPFSADIYLGKALSRESLLSACRLLAERVSFWLEKQGIVWQYLVVRLDLEGESLSFPRRFSRAQNPGSLYFHLKGIINDLRLPSPVEKITITVDGLRPAPARQLSFFGGQDPAREGRLREALAAASMVYPGAVITGSALAPSRREIMLAFYDPWRRSCRGANQAEGRME